MCGIAGTCNFIEEKVEHLDIQRMIQTLIHRGPDEEGIYISGEQFPDVKAQAGLGHRRLSIIDLQTGHQPMSNENGSIWIVFNGEIYNFPELKKTLLNKGHCFKTKSDTEVILHLYEEKGLDCVEDLRGCFAFAIWDNNEERLFLARDRVGKKPLVYRFDGKHFDFASEIKALLQKSREREIDPDSIDYFLTYGYIPSPKSIFKNIKKLPPAHILTYDNNGLKIRRYWRMTYDKKRIPFDEARERLEEILTKSVKMRLISDVPLGAFLSGGIDSSTVVALMTRLCNAPVKTFTIGFEEEDYSELKFARKVAERLNTEHREFMVKPDAFEIMNKLVWHYNEPFGDTSCIPTYYVAKMARQSVSVVLNGDGGDESFMGYERYRAMRAGKICKYIPRPVINSMLRLYKANKRLFTKATSSIFCGLNIESRPRYVEGFLGGLLGFPDEWRRYISWMSCFQEEDKVNLYSDHFISQLNTDAAGYILNMVESSPLHDSAERAMEADVNSYLPEDLLVKMDIATMANSLEARSPFLDHCVMEFAASLPVEYKMKFLKSKYILKELAEGLLPKEILQRKKMGFAVPVDKWFREELRQLSYNMLLDAKCVGRGYFRKEFMENMLDEHSSGKINHGARIWNLLNLEIWHRIFIDQEEISPCNIR